MSNISTPFSHELAKKGAAITALSGKRRCNSNEVANLLGDHARVAQVLESRGISRRSFMKLCATLAASAGLGSTFIPQIANAVENSLIGALDGNLYPVIWMEGASCTGCTESFAQIDTPDAATIVLELISLTYSETLSAAAGWSVEEAKEQTIHAGNYILIYEGAMVEKWGGEALRVAGAPGTEHLIHAAEHANAVVALGSCAVNGGWMAAKPNAAGAIGVEQFLRKHDINVPVVNVPGCPANPEWAMAVLANVIMLDQLPELTHGSKPKEAFGQTIHDNCERRGHFENGEFVYEFGSEEEAKGYCLFPLGCRGPQTMGNCAVVKWNGRHSWCVGSGSPCLGCCTANPNNPEENWVEVNTPFYERFPDFDIAGLKIAPELIAGGVTAAMAGALAIHGVGMKMAGRTGHGVPMEVSREWDNKHPEKSIGNYENQFDAIAYDEAHGHGAGHGSTHGAAQGDAHNRKSAKKSSTSSSSASTKKDSNKTNKKGQ